MEWGLGDSTNLKSEISTTSPWLIETGRTRLWNVPQLKKIQIVEKECN
jgi:hypothetical protein